MSARDVTAGVAAEVVKPEISELLLTEFEFDSGDVRLWNGLRDLPWNGHIWTGAGSLLGISRIQETSKVRAAGMSFQLSALPVDFGETLNLLRLARHEKYRGRPCGVYLGFDDINGNIVADPYQMFAGKMDTMRIRDEAKTVTIQLTAENRLVALRRPNIRRLTPEDQESLFPGDKGLAFVPSAQELTVELPSR